MRSLFKSGLSSAARSAFFLLYYFFFFIVNLQANKAVFHSPGWNHEKKIKKITKGDVPFIRAIHGLGQIDLFHISENILRHHVFKRHKAVAHIDNHIPLDPLTLPQILGYQGETYVLSYYQNKNHLHKIDKNNNLILLESIESDFGYNYSFSIQDDLIYLNLPVLKNKKYSSILYIYDLRKNKLIESLNYSFPLKNEKGFFFHRLLKKGSQYKSFFVSKEESEEQKIIEDSIYSTSADNLKELESIEYERVKTSGFIHYPPSTIHFSDEVFLLYPAKKQAVYELKLFSYTHQLEIPLDQDNPYNVHNLKYSLVDHWLQLYYLAQIKSESRILYRPVNLKEVYNPAYIENLDVEFLTRTNGYILNYDISRINNDYYAFFFTKESDHLLYSGPDMEVSSPRIKFKVKTDVELGKIYPEISWEEPDEPSGILGYAHLIDGMPSSVPSLLNLGSEERLISTKELPIGDYYIHLLAMDKNQNISPIVHHGFRVMPYVKEGRAVKVEVIRKQIAFELPKLDEEQKSRETAYLNYIQKAREYILEKRYHLARRQLNLAIVVYPNRLELLSLLSVIHKKENAFFSKNKINITLVLSACLILGLLFQFYRMSNLKNEIKN